MARPTAVLPEPDRLLAHRDVAGSRDFQHVDTAQHRALAGAARSDHDEDLPGAQFEIDVVENGGGPVTLDQAVDDDERLLGHKRLGPCKFEAGSHPSDQERYRIGDDKIEDGDDRQCFDRTKRFDGDELTDRSSSSVPIAEASAVSLIR